MGWLNGHFSSLLGLFSNWRFLTILGLAIIVASVLKFLNIN